jgi:hypothetical protein
MTAPPNLGCTPPVLAGGGPKEKAVKKLNTAAAALAFVASALAAAPAQAAPPISSTPSDKTPHCVHDVSGRTPAVCYASFREAVRQATGGRVTDAPASARLAARDKGFEAKVNAAAEQSSLTGVDADTVISIEYMDRNEEGEDQIWKATRGCPDDNLDDVDHEISHVGWSDNQISSFHGYANCWVKHWQYASFHGASVGYNSAASYIGDPMENRTTSIQWS